jgi:hypothetical protein
MKLSFNKCMFGVFAVLVLALLIPGIFVKGYTDFKRIVLLGLGGAAVLFCGRFASLSWPKLERIISLAAIVVCGCVYLAAILVFIF